MNKHIGSSLLVCEAVKPYDGYFFIAQLLRSYKATVTLDDYVVFPDGDRIIEAELLDRVLDLLDLLLRMQFRVPL